MNAKVPSQESEELGPVSPEPKKAVRQGVEERLRRILSQEQIVQMLEVMEFTYDNAVIRRCDQKFYILFNDKGLPVRFGGSNDVKPIRPTMYKAE